MREKYTIRKLLSVTVIFAIIAMVTVISGCKKDLTEQYLNSGNEEDNDNVTITSQLHDYGDECKSFDARRLEINEDEEIIYDSMGLSDNVLYYATMQYTDNEQTITIHQYDMNSDMPKALFSFEQPVYNGVILSTPVKRISLNKDGNIELFNMYSVQEDMALWKIARRIYKPSGKEIAAVVLENSGEVQIDYDCIEDTKGNIYVTYSMFDDTDGLNRIVVKYDSEGKLIAKKEINGCFENIAVSNDGQLVVCIDNSGEYKYCYYDIDTVNKDFEAFKKANDMGLRLISATEGELLFCDSYVIYNYVPGSGEPEPLIDTRKINLDMNNIRCLVKNGEGYVCLYDDSSDSSYMSITPGGDDGNRETIRLAGVYLMSDGMKDALMEYNRNNKKYKIDIVEYGYLNPDNPVSAFAKDIATGNVPDMYVLNHMDIDYYAKKGLFAELNSYMKKDDKLNEDSFLEEYLKATAIDGNNYYLMKNIKLDAPAANSKELGQYKDGWKLDDMYKYYKSKDRGTLLYGNMSASMLVRYMIDGNLNLFIDSDKGTCNFDNQAFRDILDFGKMYNSTVHVNGNDTEWQMLTRDGKMILETELIYNISNIIYTNIVLGHDAAYVGYPSDNNSGIYIESDNCILAMSSSSDYKDEVWNIIRELMLGDYSKYRHDVITSEIPVLKDEYDSMIHDASITEKYTAEDGTLVNPLSGIIDADNIQYEAASDKHVTLLRELIGRASYHNKCNRMVDIIMEEVDKYLASENDVNKVISIVQDKLDKYINENK